MAVFAPVLLDLAHIQRARSGVDLGEEGASTHPSTLLDETWAPRGPTEPARWPAHISLGRPLVTYRPYGPYPAWLPRVQKSQNPYHVKPSFELRARTSYSPNGLFG